METGKKLGQHFYDNRYFYLLAATMLQVFLASFFPDRGNMLINQMTFSIFMLANINFIRYNRRTKFYLVGFAAIGIALAWIPAQSELGQKVFVAERILVMLFLSVIISMIISSIVRSKIVNVNMILGVITIYILFGMVAGEVNQLIYHLDPHAFNGNLNPEDPANLRYFSFVTMTTLGYGDIVPASQMARASAVFFSLVGQIYLAVVIALIVGKYVSSSDKKERLE